MVSIKPQNEFSETIIFAWQKQSQIPFAPLAKAKESKINQDRGNDSGG